MKCTLKCEWNNFFITVLTCKFLEISSEILRTLPGSGILQVICLDGTVKYVRSYSLFTTQEELGQEEVKGISVEKGIPVSIEKIFQEPRGSKRCKVLF